MPKARLPKPVPGLARLSHRDRVNRITRLIDQLMALHSELLASLNRGEEPDLDAFNTACRHHQRDLNQLGEIGADAADARTIRQRFQRLGALNRQTQAAVHKQLGTLRDRLLNLRTGRRTLAGYERTAGAGRRPGALLGRG